MKKKLSGDIIHIKYLSLTDIMCLLFLFFQCVNEIFDVQIILFAHCYLFIRPIFSLALDTLPL